MEGCLPSEVPNRLQAGSYKKQERRRASEGCGWFNQIPDLTRGRGNRGVKPLLLRLVQGGLQIIEKLRRLHGHLALIAGEQIRSKPMPDHSARGGEQ